MYTDSGILLCMPKVTVYIRNEDYPKWLAIADKPEWLHEHLNTFDSTVSYNSDGRVVTTIGRIPNGAYGIAYDERGIDTEKMEPIVDPTYTDAEDVA